MTGAASTNSAAFSSVAVDVERASRISADVSGFGSVTSGNSEAIVRSRDIRSWASGVNLLAGSSCEPAGSGSWERMSWHDDPMELLRGLQQLAREIEAIAKDP